MTFAHSFRMDRVSHYMASYGANIAGHLYNAGGFILLLGGAITSSPLNVIAALLNFGASFTLGFFGRSNAGVAFSAMLAIIINLLVAWPGLANGEFTSYFGIAIAFAMQTMAAESASLEKKYNHNASTFLRETLGQPRRTCGLTQFVFCRWPLIYGNIDHDRYLPAIVFIIWALADLSFAMSKPTSEQPNT